MGQVGQFIVNHWQLWAMLIVILIGILINEVFAQKRRAKELSPQALVALINQDDPLTIIDLRDKEIFRTGHIIHSISVSIEDFEQQRMDKYKTKKIVLVCARGLQSPALAAKLRHQGFQPMVLAGGISAWQSADLPLVKGK